MPRTIANLGSYHDFHLLQTCTRMRLLPAAMGRRRLRAGVTLIETLVSMVIILVGLAGLFGTNAQSFRLLRRSKEIVAAREDLLCRLDTIRTLSYSQLAKSYYLSTSTLVRGTAGDPNPFGTTNNSMQNFTETVTVYALGWQLFSSDADRANITPDSATSNADPSLGVGSQMDSVAPAAPKTYKANSSPPVKGGWTLAVAGALPYIQVTRVGTGVDAVVTVNTAGDLSAYPQLRVDIVYTWTDSSNITHTQVGSTVVSRNGSLL
jgi:type II secretory pathway pseudopilin PulG